jgi:hypothetical protein
MKTFRIGSKELRFQNEISEQHRAVKNIITIRKEPPVKTLYYIGRIAIVTLIFLDKYMIIKFCEIKRDGFKINNQWQ